MTLASALKNLSNAVKKAVGKELCRQKQREATMNTAAASTSSGASKRDVGTLAKQPLYDDLVTPEQLAAERELVGFLDESKLKDIRPRTW